MDSKKGPGPKHMKEITKRARRREAREVAKAKLEAPPMISFISQSNPNTNGPKVINSTNSSNSFGCLPEISSSSSLSTAAALIFHGSHPFGRDDLGSCNKSSLGDGGPYLSTRAQFQDSLTAKLSSNDCKSPSYCSFCCNYCYFCSSSSPYCCCCCCCYCCCCSVARRHRRCSQPPQSFAQTQHRTRRGQTISNSGTTESNNNNNNNVRKSTCSKSFGDFDILPYSNIHPGATRTRAAAARQLEAESKLLNEI